jgi:uncharacterized protein (TIGR02145 family)
MKYLYLLLSLFLAATTQGQTQDTLYVWKAGNLVIKQSIKPVDIDSITFKRPVVNIPQVTICNQVWATKNLNVTTYRNGEQIPYVNDPTAWANLTTGAYCSYNNDSANDAIYGKLYNWYAVNDQRGLAPTGYHVPTDTEWTTLTTCLGEEALEGGKMKETGTTHWLDPNEGANNSSGFTALPGGFRGYDGAFYDIGGNGLWWSSSENEPAYAWYRVLSYDNTSVGRFYVYEATGFSVRCLRD